jgi:hypothetical protein
VPADGIVRASVGDASRVIQRVSRRDFYVATVVFLSTIAAFPFEDSHEVYLSLAGIAVVIFGLVSPRVAWTAFLFSMCVSGLEMRLFGFTVLLEHIAILPLFVHVVRAVLRRRQDVTRIGFTQSRSMPYALVAAVALVFWVVVNLVTSLSLSPDSAQSLKLLAWVSLNIIAAILTYKLEVPIADLVRDLVVVLGASTFACLTIWALSSSTGVPNAFVERDYASALFRLQGLMLEPNLVAAFLLLGACVAVRFQAVLPRALLLAYLAIATVGIFLTFTRASSVLICVVLVAYFWPHMKVALRVFVLIVAATIAVAFLGSSSGSSATGPPLDSVSAVLAERASSVLDFGNGTGAIRVYSARIAMDDIARDGVVVGHGFNVFPQRHESNLLGYDGELYLGLLWLVIFYDGGLIGACFFLMAFFASWKMAGIRSGFLFFVGFAVVASTTNPIWYAFAWVFAAVLMRGRSRVDANTMRGIPAPRAPKPREKAL